MNTRFYRNSLFALTACLPISTSAESATDKAEKPAPLRGNDCVFFRAVFDWQELDKNNLVIWAPGRREAYHVYLAMPLLSTRPSVQLAFIDKDGDGHLCGFSSDEIAISDGNFPQRSTITAMKRLEADGIAKLEEQFKTSLSRDAKKKKPKEPSPATAL